MVAQVTAITQEPPSTADPANFDTEADAFLGALPNFQDQLNAVALEVNNTSNLINGYYATSTTTATPSVTTISFTLQQANKSFVVGQPVSVYDISTPDTRYMVGTVYSFVPATGVMQVAVTTAVGTQGSNWAVASTAPFIDNSPALKALAILTFIGY
jgi:hypothetical protein